MYIQYWFYKREVFIDMSEILTSDATIVTKRGQTYLIATTLHIRNLENFRKSYFEVIEEFCSRNNIKKCYPVIKSGDISTHIPGFDFREERQQLISDLWDIEEIKKVHTIFGYHPEEVVLYGHNKQKGLDFLKGPLFNYFPLISIWSYLNYEDNREHIYPDDIVKIDGINGKITKAWKDVGKFFNKIEIIPKGDEIYPELSWVDLVSNYIARTLPYSTTFENEDSEIIYKPIPIFDLSDDIYITHEYINSGHDEFIVPDLHHDIKAKKFYPHPIYYITYDDIVKKEHVEQTTFFERVKEKAYAEDGCVKFMDISRDINNIQNGDYIISISESKNEAIKRYIAMNWDKDINYQTMEEFKESLE